MSGGSAERIEAAVDAGAAALLGAAAAFVFAKLGAATLFAAVGAAFAFIVAFIALRAIRPESAVFPIGGFAPPDIEVDGASELLLTDADRLALETSPDELVLDDILAKLGPDSRVVRLFDPASMPTPGQLKARIDRHLGSEQPEADASGALHEALAELRRSLR